MVGRVKGYFKYAFKAILAAATPFVIELVDNLAIEMTNLVQLGVTTVVGGIAVFVARNAVAPN